MSHKDYYQENTIIRKNFSTLGMVGYWKNLPRELVTAPSLSSRCVWATLSGLWWDSLCTVPGFGLDDTDGSFQLSIFYDFFLCLIIFCVACLRFILVGFSPFHPPFFPFLTPMTPGSCVSHLLTCLNSSPTRVCMTALHTCVCSFYFLPLIF